MPELKRIVNWDDHNSVIEKCEVVTITFPTDEKVRDDTRDPLPLGKECKAKFKNRIDMVRGLLSKGHNLYKLGKGKFYITFERSQPDYPGRMELQLPKDVFIQAYNRKP